MSRLLALLHATDYGVPSTPIKSFVTCEFSGKLMSPALRCTRLSRPNPDCSVRARAQPDFAVNNFGFMAVLSVNSPTDCRTYYAGQAFLFDLYER